MINKSLDKHKTYDFVCYKCFSFACSKCMLDHIKENPDHSKECKHLDEIEHSLNNMNLDDFIDTIPTTTITTTTTTTTNNNYKINESTGTNSSNDNNSSNNKISQINNEIQMIWESLRSSSSLYQRLSTTENDIKQHFEQLHQYLIIEEHRLQRDIINDKHTIENHINFYMDRMKTLILVINIYNKVNSNNDNHDDDSDNSSDDQSIIEDTASLYSTTTIMESIRSCSSLHSFINDSKSTLLNEFSFFNTDIDELLKQPSDDVDARSVLLDSIYLFNNELKSTKNIDNDLSLLSSYKLSIKQPDFNQLNSIIKQSIKLDKIGSNESINTTTTTNNNDNKQSYIFITHKPNGATLINTSNNYSVEELKFDYQFTQTYNSIVSIGEYIYIFGGYGNINKWMKISMKSKSAEHIGDFEGDSNISVCYDGQDHIYLVNGYHKKNNIDRFNIKTLTFERLYQLPQGYGTQGSSMIFKGSLYSISQNQNRLFEFDLTNRTIENHNIHFIPLSACHDNNGNFYILDRINKRFIKYNVETKQISKLNATSLTNGQQSFVMYHRESPTSSYIFSFGPSLDCNFKYSIESNRCQPFFRNIKNHNRAWCASTSITL
ncbi:hypothetical protein PPL_04941 [Heterostelium album PN500]|uniref:B box-type domain-containing protein n=1 Tax=Heterostelium pallidum (strain ATCC 26659 / Pp 5 / PN500) TaxID=670386 RepID=D3B8Z7_HETP5|nr:hypothetical protein PPL_04941 [Heterostelium album PN500]EFA82036.1 hypothetical protein PPL_04941 [Heterostelium album PN500]|eukprot:XP_020434153.1 hypothetical protein PPL_04941 [Heterostelium album PN500]